MMDKPCDAFFGREQESSGLCEWAKDDKGLTKLYCAMKQEQEMELEAKEKTRQKVHELVDKGFDGDMQTPIIAKQPPTYTHQGDAGADLYSRNSLKLAKGDIISAPTGVRVAIPAGYVGLIQPRSSMSAKGILAATGVIDSGYRGEIKVTLLNLSGASTMVMSGDRVAQLLLIPVARAEFVAVEELPGSERGTSGFGSSGR